MAHETAILAGGCFWCTEAVFNDVVGVLKVESGYTGGQTTNPTYKQVCGGDTGHAEAIRITFDPQAISYDELLDVFLGTHDPTQLNRQGNDIGTQYRSAIFPHDEGQEAAADLLVGRVGGLPASIAALDLQDADDVVEHRLCAPEAPARQNRLLLCHVAVSFKPPHGHERRRC